VLLKEHKVILNYVVEKWKANNGGMVKLRLEDDDYKKLKELMRGKIKELDDNHIKTAIFYLEEIGLIIRPTHLTNKEKYVPTPEGLEYSKPWLFRESSYKWYVNIFLTLLGLIIGLLTKIDGGVILKILKIIKGALSL